MNASLRLVWTYLFRCKEVSSTSTSKLDTVLRPFFPAARLGLYPPPNQDEDIEPFIVLVHFVMCRHAEYGRELALKLLQESTILSATGSVNPGDLLAPERMIVAIRAILFTLDAMQKDTMPIWPSNANFNEYHFRQDYHHTSLFLPDTFYAKAEVQEFYDRYGPILSRLANICGMAVGSMFIFEKKYTPEQAYSNPEERDFMVQKKYGEKTVVFRRELVPQIELLKTIFESWPRCLHPSMPLADTLDYLIRGVIHVDPSMGISASQALKRIATDPRYSKAALSRFTRFLFSADSVAKEGSGTELVLEQASLMILWETMVVDWAKSLVEVGSGVTSPTSPAEPEVFLEMGVPITVQSVLDDIEAGALFLLTHNMRRLRVAGIRTLRLLGTTVEQMSRDPDSYPGQPNPSPNRHTS